MTRKTPAFWAVLGLLALTAPAWAGPAEGPPGATPPGPGAPAAQWEAQRALSAEYQTRLGPLEDQLWAKEMEYEALLRGGGFSQAEAKTLIGEMLKLREKIRAERLALSGRPAAKTFGPGPWRDDPRGWGGHHGWGGGCRGGWGHGG